MFKKVYDLNFSKYNQFVIYLIYRFFGIYIYKKTIASFKEPEHAIKYFKTLIK